MQEQTRHSRFSLVWAIIKYGLLIGIGVFVLAIGGLYYVYSHELPSNAEIYHWQPPQSTQILDRNGNVLYEVYGDEKRIDVPSNQIAPALKEATVSIEDARFYKHHGIDPIGTVRALWRNWQSHAIVEGGSTITQQLAKNAFLTSNRTITRKIKEALLAIKLERHYSKDQILTMYLNDVAYGGNAYGAEAAANVYFGKPAKDLTLSEAATLAAITKSPTYYSPYGNHTKELVARRNTVLDRMAELHYISPDQAQTAKSVALVVKPYQEKIAAPHFAMYVKQLLIDKYGEAMVDSGGLQVTTTLDPATQKMAEDAVAHATATLQRSGASNAGMVAIDPKTGGILAMVGSRNYFDKAHDGNVNVTTSLRSPGSAFKPLLYATAFEKGPWGPASTLFDLPTNFGDKIPYIPQDYEPKPRGPVSARDALAQSLNVPAVKLEDLVGKDATINSAKQVGITTFTNPDSYGLALAIGGADVKLLELTGAYGALANSGQFNAPIAITKITQHGTVIYQAPTTPQSAFHPEVAYEISSILSDAQARAPIFGTGGPLVIPGHDVAVKTGTSDNFHDALTIGYTPSVVAGVWVGNNNNRPLVQGSIGAMAAAPIWNDFMTHRLQNQPNEPFAKPDSLQTITVDAVTGLLPTSGTRQTRQDIAASWQMPTQSMAQLASYSVYGCDGKLVSQQSGYLVHSEKPSNPNWEKPVEDWARTHGYPTGKLNDVHEKCTAPTDQPQTNLADQSAPPIGVGGVDIRIPASPDVPSPLPVTPTNPSPPPDSEDSPPSPNQNSRRNRLPLPLPTPIPFGDQSPAGG